MKKLKRIFSLMIAVVMVLAMNVSVFATGGGVALTTYKITIKEVPTDDHTFTAYQIFKGDLSQDGVLSNVDWGAGVDATKEVEGKNLIVTLQSEDEIGEYFADCETAADVANVLSSANTGDPSDKVFTNNSANIDAFAKVLEAFLTTGTSSSGTPSKETSGYTYTISGLAAGYYFVKDTGDLGNPESDAYSKFMLQVVDNAEVTVKTDVPTSEKKVDDKNDSNTTEDGESWQDSADYDIGDHVPYQLKATLPDNVSDYESYKLKLNKIAARWPAKAVA